jgi:hypothetical protein
MPVGRLPYIPSPSPGYVSPGSTPAAPAYTPPPEPAVAEPIAATAETTPATTSNPLLAMLPAGVTPRMAGIYAGLGVLALILLAVGVAWYQGAAKADTARKVAAADKSIAAVMKDESNVGDKAKAAFDPVKGPESPSKNYNGDSVRAAIKGVQPALDSAQKTVEKDQGTIRTALASINDRGVMSVTSGGDLDHKAGQLEAVGHALDVRSEEIVTAKGQLTLLNDMTTAEDNFNGLLNALDHQDLVVATARYTPANNAIKQAVADTQATNTPDALRGYVAQVSDFVDATQAVINSIQARDFGQYQASLRIFTIKLENIIGYDPKVMRQQLDDMVKNYDDRYNSYIHDAGLVTGTKAV